MEQNINDIEVIDLKDTEKEDREGDRRKRLLEEKKRKESIERTSRFEKLFFPSIIYAAVFALCLYDNISGILVPVFAAFTFGYSIYMLKALEKKIKKMTCFGGIVMILLGLSSCLSGNEGIHFSNMCGIFLILIFILIHSVYDDDKWGLLKNIGAIVVTVGEAISAFSDPFSDLLAYTKSDKKKDNKNVMNIILGVLLAVPITAVAVGMLMSADVVFKTFSEKLFGEINFGTLFSVALVFVIGFFLAYCGFTALLKKTVNEEVKDLRTHSAVVAITALVAVSLVYVVFCYIQIAYLFTGGMSLPDGYTYAEYLHEGFYQLLFVCIMNLALVLCSISFFEKNKILTGLLMVISGCTGIMIASCALRITMYVKAYGLSVLRFVVYWALIVITAFLIGIVLQIMKPSFRLFRYSFIVFCLAYILLVFIRPDYQVASYNLNVLDAREETAVDFYYLSKLSSDAAPAIAKYMESATGEKNITLNKYVDRMSTYELVSYRKFNFSKNKARNLFTK